MAEATAVVTGLLQKSEVKVSSVEDLCREITLDTAPRVLSVLNELLTEEVSGLRKAHEIKEEEADEETVWFHIIRKLILEISSRLDKEGYKNAGMLFLDSEADKKSSSHGTEVKKKRLSALKKAFASPKGDTVKDLNFNLKYGKGMTLDCSSYSLSVLTQELLRLLDHNSPLLCGNSKSVFNKYIFAQAKLEGWTKVQNLMSLVSSLPELNQLILKDLFTLLTKVWRHSEDTGMDDEMLAFTLGPRLLRPDKSTKLESVMNSRTFVQGAVVCILRNSTCICRTPPLLLPQPNFDLLQKVIDAMFSVLCSALDNSKEAVLSVDNLIRVIQSVRLEKPAKDKNPFLRCNVSLPMKFWSTIATIKRDGQLRAYVSGSSREPPAFLAQELLRTAMIAGQEEKLDEVVDEIRQGLQLRDDNLAQLTSLKVAFCQKSSLKLPLDGQEGDAPRGSRGSLTTAVSCAECDQLPLCAQTKFCRVHFDQHRADEDPNNLRRWRGKRPGRNCDVLTSLPASMIDLDLGLKLSYPAAFVLQNAYRDDLVYDVLCLEAPPADDAPPSPGPPVFVDFQLVRRRAGPPDLFQLPAATLQDEQHQDLSDEQAQVWILKQARTMLDDSHEEEALQPPPHLNMNLPHLKTVWEIITTEETYVKVLKFVADVYVAKLRGSGYLSEDEVDLLFRNIARMSNFHVKFLSDLYRKFCTWTDDISTQRIGEVIVSFDESFRVYPTYVNKHDEALELLRRLSTSPRYSRFQQFQKEARGPDLSSCLIAPIQRIPRYRLLLQEVLKQLEKNCPQHPDIPQLQDALKIVMVQADQVNEQLRRSEQERDMQELKEELTGTERHGQLVTGARYLMYRGNLVRVCRKSDRVYHFFLFNDLLLYTTKNPPQPGRSKSYAIQKWIPIDEGFSVSPVPSSEARPSGWAIRSKVKSFEMYPEDSSKYATWNEKLMSLRAEMKDATSDEVQPVWEPDAKTASCKWCARKFTMVTRRHHCRDCGEVVCGQCSSQKLILPSSNGQNVRVCDRCHEKRSGERAPARKGSVRGLFTRLEAPSKLDLSPHGATHHSPQETKSPPSSPPSPAQGAHSPRHSPRQISSSPLSSPFSTSNIDISKIEIT